MAINNSGEAVGNDPGFAYQNGSITYIQPPAANDGASCTDINNSGDIIGTYSVAASLDPFSGPITTHGYLYKQGTYTTIDPPGAIPSSDTPLAINKQDQVVGNYTDASGNGYGFIYQNGNYTTLKVPGATSTDAEDINDKGEVVGTWSDSAGGLNAYVYNHGVYTTLALPGNNVRVGLAINNSGVVVGTTGYGAFVYDNGTYTTLSGPGGAATTLTDINDKGDITGYYFPDPQHVQAFIARPGPSKTVTMSDLVSGQAAAVDLLPAVPTTGGFSQSAISAAIPDSNWSGTLSGALPAVAHDTVIQLMPSEQLG
jgi:uncharacterized membrane protein